jgi:hypothetical protein
MLRFLVNAAAGNMMLVQCNSDVPISLACSILVVGISPDHGIIGTTFLGSLKAGSQAVNGRCFMTSFRLGCCRCVRSEGCNIDLHPVKDHSNPPRPSNYGTPPAAATGNLCCACSQPCRGKQQLTKVADYRWNAAASCASSQSLHACII